MSSLCIKLHRAHRSALPAAKQKEAEEMETFWWEPDASALWTQNQNTLLSVQVEP